MREAEVRGVQRADGGVERARSEEEVRRERRRLAAEAKVGKLGFATLTKML